MSNLTYADFPKTRYQGSKKSLLPWLYDEFLKIEFNTFLDIFGGTGAVSYLAKTMGKVITYNDYLASNVISAKALIKNNNIKLPTDLVKPFFELQITEGVVSRLYNDVFFTKDENALIDTVFNGICYDLNLKLRGAQKNLALHSFFQALLMKRPFNLFHRANLEIRTNSCERKFGNKTTWETPIEELMVRNLKEANHAVFNNGNKHTVLNKDALKIESGFDLVYVDPPYYSQHSNRYVDYYDYYSFLEGLCCYKKWENRINYSKKNLPLKKKKSSFQRCKFMDDLESLLSIHKESIVVMSFKSPGPTATRDLEQSFMKTHKAPTIRSIAHTYSLNKNNGHYYENLIIAYPKK